jgi:hypothetical protein
VGRECGAYALVYNNESTARVDSPGPPTLYPAKVDPTRAGTVYTKAGLYRKAVATHVGGRVVGNLPDVGYILYHDELRREVVQFRAVPQLTPLLRKLGPKAVSTLQLLKRR